MNCIFMRRKFPKPAPTTATVTASIDHGTITGAGTYEIGASCTIRATPSSGYTFVSFSVNGVIITQNPYTFTVTGDTVVTATTRESTISVTISGTGNTDRCYAIINGTKRYAAGTYTVLSGDTITFGVYGTNKESGWVKINETTVITVTSVATQTYSWTVPNDIQSMSINMVYSSRAGTTYGRITVTTS